MRCLGCRWDGTGQEFMLVYWEKPWAVNVESTMFFSWVMWALRAALIGNQPQQIKGHTIAIGRRLCDKYQEALQLCFFILKAACC